MTHTVEVIEQPAASVLVTEDPLSVDTALTNVEVTTTETSTEIGVSPFVIVNEGSGGGVVFEHTLASSSSIGATSVVLDRAPTLGASLGFLVIDPGGSNCETRRVSGVAGSTVTLANGLTQTSSAISFTAATKRITGVNVARFFPGQKIIITGSASNNGTFTVAGYPADGTYDASYITVVETVVDESAGASVTIRLDLTRAHAAGAKVFWTDGPISATWYGAKASGSSADAAANTLALQRWLDDTYYSQCYDLYLPGFMGGRYFVDGPLYMEKNTHIHGPNQKAAVIAAAPTFASWDDNVAVLQTRLNGRVTKFGDAGADRYFISGLGIDGLGVAYAKNTSYSASSDLNGTAFVTAATNTVAIHATLHKGNSSDNNRLVYRALSGGTGGNSIRVAHVNDGASQPLTVTVSGNDITVHLATNGSSVITSTASDVVGAVNAHGGASALVNASLGYAGMQKFNTAGSALVDLNEGTGLVSAFALTALEAGTAPFAAGDVGRSIYLGMRDGAREITAFTNSHTVTVSGAAFATTRAGIQFVVSPVNGFITSCNQTCIFQDMRIEECYGYASAFIDCQEFSVKNLMTFNCSRHIRLFGVQFGHFQDLNLERSADAYITFEGSSINRSNTFLNGHIEDITPCDYFRAEGTAICEGNAWLGTWQATTFKGSRTLRFESGVTNTPTYGISGFNWSGPNDGTTFVSDGKRGYSIPMTDFLTDNNFSCDHFFVRDGRIQANRNTVSKTSAYTMRLMDEVCLANATGGAFSVTLPSPVGIKAMRFTVKRVNSGSNVVTIDTPGAETIDGLASYGLNAQYDALTVISDGTNWHVVGEPDTTGGGGGGYPRNFKSGLYYVAPSSTITSDTALAMTLDRVVYVPFAVGEANTFDRLAVSVTTNGAATAVVRLGIYSDTDGQPDALVVDGGTIDSSTNGYKEVTIAQALSAGTLYWIAICAQVITCSLRAAAAGNGSEWVGGTQALDIRTSNYIQAGVTGAFPANATPASGTTQNPIAKLRAA